MTGGGRGFCNPYSPLNAGGFAPPAYWPRPAVSPFGAGYYPQMPAYPPMYGFARGVWPQMMGGIAGLRGGRAGFGRGLGMGFGRGMGMGFRGRGRAW